VPDPALGPPSSGSFQGLIDPRRQLAFGTDTTVQYDRSTLRTQPWSIACGATLRIGHGRRSVRAHRCALLTIGPHRVVRHHAWSSDRVYAAAHREGG